MKKVNYGRLLKEQGKMDDALEILENILFSEYSTLNFAVSMMMGIALEQSDTDYAEYLADRSKELAKTFEMGKYYECSSKLNIVCAQKDIKGTFDVVSHLLDSIDSMYDFRKSKLYRHKHFKDIDSSYFESIKENLLEGCRTDEEYEYMKGYEPWENLIQPK